MNDNGKILIAGGTGLIGQALATLLKKEGFNLVILSRSDGKNNNFNYYKWDIENKIIEKEAFENVQVIINLSGENIGNKRWTKKQKQKILNSRTAPIQLLLQKAKEYNMLPKVFISASAVGFYGTKNTEHIYTETDKVGNDFLSEVCEKWEKQSLGFEKEGVRMVVLRTPIVLSSKGGAFVKMLNLAKQGINTQMGNGKQFMPWIHINDLCNMYLFAIRNNISGIYNAVADETINNEMFASILAKCLKKKILTPPAPAFIIQLVFGELSNILLKGVWVSNRKIKQESFNFRYKHLEESIMSLL